MANSNDATTKVQWKENLRTSATIPLKYPENLYEADGEMSKYTVFQIYSYGKTQVNHAEITDLLGTIYLPLPPELSNSDAFAYEEFSAPLLQTGLEAAQQDGVGASIDKTLGLLGVAASQAFSNFSTTKNLPNEVAALAGLSVNPRNTNVFKSPVAREHKFTFKLIAKSAEESTAIRNIINRFKFHAHPDSSWGESFYDTPELFKIAFKINDKPLDDKDTFLFHPLPSALVAIAVSYNGASTPVFYKNTGAPVEVVLSLMFREMELDSKSKMQDRYNGLGTQHKNIAKANNIAQVKKAEAYVDSKLSPTVGSPPPDIIAKVFNY